MIRQKILIGLATVVVVIGGGGGGGGTSCRRKRSVHRPPRVNCQEMFATVQVRGELTAYVMYRTTLGDNLPGSQEFHLRPSTPALLLALPPPLSLPPRLKMKASLSVTSLALMPRRRRGPGPPTGPDDDDVFFFVFWLL